jgi:hypothetical protein
MFILTPASQFQYGPHGSTTNPRSRYLSAVADARSAQAEYAAALARKEAAHQRLLATRERAYFDSIYGSHDDYPYSFDDSHQSRFDRHFSPPSYEEEPLTYGPYFTSPIDLHDRVHELRRRELRLQQLEEQRRLALRAQAEELANRRSEFLRRYRQLPDVHFIGLRERDNSKDMPGCPCKVSLIKVSVFHLSDKMSKASNSCEPKERPSVPDLHSLVFGSQLNQAAFPKRRGCRANGACGPLSRTPTEPKAPSKEQSSSQQPASSQPAPKEAEKLSLKEKLVAHLQKDGDADIGQAIRSFISALSTPSQSEATPQTPTASQPASLKDQLEARLYSDPDLEIRDTVQALLASLFMAPSTTPAPTGPETPKGKGKAKVVSFDIPAPTPTSNDVAHALNSVRNIEASFFVLESDFVFPTTLDLNEDALSIKNVGKDSDSDSVSSLSLDQKLAYTARNAPVRYYEQALSSLLVQLDAIESFGNDEVRARRKEIVNKVEKALEEIEKKVEARLQKAEKAKESAVDHHRVVEQVQVTETPIDSATPHPPVEESNLHADSEVVVASENQVDQDASPAEIFITPAVPSEDVLVPMTPAQPVAEAASSDGDHDSTPSLGVQSSIDVDAAAVELELDPIQVIQDVAIPSENVTIVPDATTFASIPSSPSPEPENIDTFLLPGSQTPSETTQTPSPLDAGSDEDTWSEVEA